MLGVGRGYDGGKVICREDVVVLTLLAAVLMDSG
jgi:hypothetical protein